MPTQKGFLDCFNQSEMNYEVISINHQRFKKLIKYIKGENYVFEDILN